MPLTIFSLFLLTILIPFTRRLVFTGPLFRFAKTIAPKISTFERQSIEIGQVGFDAELFSGRPDWETFRAIPKIQLTEEEQKFLDGPTREFCELIDDWNIRRKNKKIGDEVWEFAKKHGFLGLRISKKSGGYGFSAQAQSIILGMIASRSIDVSIIAEVPNSLGPDELIEQYGTEAQKEQYLKRFVSGEEIPCFAITSAAGGSDIASMQDVGVVTHQMFNGKKTLGVKISWAKRYITLAPDATLLVLAFQLTDPQKILKRTDEDLGITLALIPSTHSGVNIGRRHLPSGAAFPNGPTSGKDVFIPIDWIIGGEKGIGQGWKMVMQCLVAGRSVSVPSMSVATTKLMLMTSTAYAKIRRQFGKSISDIEGVEEVLARIVENAYIAESARAVTAASVNAEHHPLVIASIMKYKMTELARSSVLDAMDIHGGKGVIDGPLNYLQSAYQMIPVAITAEGSNIITRSLIVLGQGILRSHPYIKEELESLAEEKRGVEKFDKAFSSHVGFFIQNLLQTFFHTKTLGIFTKAGKTTPKILRYWYKQLSLSTKIFAFMADVAILFYKGKLKKKQRASARLADALSELYLLSCILKRFEDDGLHADDYPIVVVCLKNGLFRFKNSIDALINNIPNFLLRLILRVITFSWNNHSKCVSDHVASQAVQSVIYNEQTRNRLIRYTYIPEEGIQEPIGLLETAFKKSKDLEDVLKKIEQSIRSKKLIKTTDFSWITTAKGEGIISSSEAEKLQEFLILVEKIIVVDDFDKSEVKSL